MRIEDRIRRSIAQRPSSVVLRSDFAGMGSSAQVGRALANLVALGKLVRISKGAFAKTRINKFTGKPAPVGTLETIANELFKKLGVEVYPSKLVADYNLGKSTQLPAGASVSTGRRRISRKICFGNRTLSYENDFRNPKV